MLENLHLDEYPFHQRGTGTVRSEPSFPQLAGRESRAIRTFESIALPQTFPSAVQFRAEGILLSYPSALDCRDKKETWP
jgi:hypothetical protein